MKTEQTTSVTVPTHETHHIIVAMITPTVKQSTRMVHARAAKYRPTCTFIHAQ